MATLVIEGLDKLTEKFENLEEGVSRKDLLDTMGAFMIHKIRERFLNQEAPDGSRWSESLAAQRRKFTGRDGGTLFDTGNLFHSITLGRSGVDGRSIFTTVDYAEKHNEGLDGAPRRHFLGFNQADENSMINIVNDRIRRFL